MRALIQRVSRASVRVDGRVTGAIEQGMLVLLGVAHEDGEAEAEALARKVLALRIFEDDAGKMNLDLAASGGAVLCVSQFTLHADVRKGNRPSFVAAAPPEQAERLYEHFCGRIEAAGARCERGVFGAHMDVELLNDGPVTILVDTDELQRPRNA